MIGKLLVTLIIIAVASRALYAYIRLVLDAIYYEDRMRFEEAVWYALCALMVVGLVLIVNDI
jgi:hypothetical protein